MQQLSVTQQLSVMQRLNLSVGDGFRAGVCVSTNQVSNA